MWYRYGGGRKDLSETMAGTLWTADALFAFAAAGARAFHLHWGKGGEPNGDAPPSVGVQTNFDFKVRTTQVLVALLSHPLVLDITTNNWPVLLY